MKRTLSQIFFKFCNTSPHEPQTYGQDATDRTATGHAEGVIPSAAKYNDSDHAEGVIPSGNPGWSEAEPGANTTVQPAPEKGASILFSSFAALRSARNPGDQGDSEEELISCG